jgi:hypothetical protein
VSGVPRAAVATLAAAACFASGCGGDDDAATPRPRTQTTAAAEREPTPPSAPRARTVRFAAADGKTVSAQFVAAGKRAPAVVLLHEIRGGPDQWDDLVPYLHAAGFATLAYQSRPSAIERERLPDALAAVRYLRSRRDVDSRRLALVGASIGASTAVLAMASRVRRTVDAAVALSPPDSADIWALQDKGRYRPHDMLLVSDEREAPSAESMLDGALRSKAMRSSRPGHGVALLAEPGVRRALLSWLEERLKR